MSTCWTTSKRVTTTFQRLDNRFHRLVNESSPNRFIDDFSDIITLIFHYHYQWNKADEKERNKAAIMEHLAYIEALQSRNRRRIELGLPKALAICAQHTLAIANEVIGASLGGSRVHRTFDSVRWRSSRPQTIKAVA